MNLESQWCLRDKGTLNTRICVIVALRVNVQVFKRLSLKDRIKEWAESGETYTCRFGLEMLMIHYLDENFKSSYLEIPASVCSDEYYVKMMIAWFFATALAKRWHAAIKYLETERLDLWTHNKTIQKACESFRITSKQKEYLKAMKRK